MSESSNTERYNVTIKEMPSQERPRERLLRLGPGSLSTAELLAIQLRTGSRERSALGIAELILSQFSDLRGVANASVEELCRVKGLGPVKAIQIASAMELGKRLRLPVGDTRPCINDPGDVAHMLMDELRDARREHFVVISVDSKNRVIKKATVSVGILDSSLVHPREVFREAISVSASAIVVAHNHPSGDPTPSGEDHRITKRLVESGAVIGIEVLDHVILGDDRWVSLKERGLM